MRKAFETWNEAYEASVKRGAELLNMTSYDFERRENLSALIGAYNEASNPAALRTDEEHAIQRERAKIALRSIRRCYIEGIDYHEMSNGALREGK